MKFLFAPHLKKKVSSAPEKSKYLLVHFLPSGPHFLEFSLGSPAKKESNSFDAHWVIGDMCFALPRETKNNFKNLKIKLTTNKDYVKQIDNYSLYRAQDIFDSFSPNSTHKTEKVDEEENAVFSPCFQPLTGNQTKEKEASQKETKSEEKETKEENKKKQHKEINEDDKEINFNLTKNIYESELTRITESLEGRENSSGSSKSSHSTAQVVKKTKAAQTKKKGKSQNPIMEQLEQKKIPFRKVEVKKSKAMGSKRSRNHTAQPADKDMKEGYNHTFQPTSDFKEKDNPKQISLSKLPTFQKVTTETLKSNASSEESIQKKLKSSVLSGKFSGEKSPFNDTEEGKKIEIPYISKNLNFQSLQETERTENSAMEKLELETIEQMFGPDKNYESPTIPDLKQTTLTHEQLKAARKEKIEFTKKSITKGDMSPAPLEKTDEKGKDRLTFENSISTNEPNALTASLLSNNANSTCLPLNKLQRLMEKNTPPPNARTATSMQYTNKNNNTTGNISHHSNNVSTCSYSNYMNLRNVPATNAKSPNCTQITSDHYLCGISMIDNNYPPFSTNVSLLKTPENLIHPSDNFNFTNAANQAAGLVSAGDGSSTKTLVMQQQMQITMLQQQIQELQSFIYQNQSNICCSQMTSPHILRTGNLSTTQLGKQDSKSKEPYLNLHNRSAHTYATHPLLNSITSIHSDIASSQELPLLHRNKHHPNPLHNNPPPPSLQNKFDFYQSSPSFLRANTTTDIQNPFGFNNSRDSIHDISQINRLSSSLKFNHPLAQSIKFNPQLSAVYPQPPQNNNQHCFGYFGKGDNSEIKVGDGSVVNIADESKIPQSEDEQNVSQDSEEVKIEDNSPLKRKNLENRDKGVKTEEMESKNPRKDDKSLTDYTKNITDYTKTHFHEIKTKAKISEFIIEKPGKKKPILEHSLSKPELKKPQRLETPKYSSSKNCRGLTFNPSNDLIPGSLNPPTMRNLPPVNDENESEKRFNLDTDSKFCIKALQHSNTDPFNMEKLILQSKDYSEESKISPRGRTLKTSLQSAQELAPDKINVIREDCMRILSPSDTISTLSNYTYSVSNISGNNRTLDTLLTSSVNATHGRDMQNILKRVSLLPDTVRSPSSPPIIQHPQHTQLTQQQHPVHSKRNQHLYLDPFDSALQEVVGLIPEEEEQNMHGVPHTHPHRQIQIQGFNTNIEESANTASLLSVCSVSPANLRVRVNTHKQKDRFRNSNDDLSLIKETNESTGSNDNSNTKKYSNLNEQFKTPVTFFFCEFFL